MGPMIKLFGVPGETADGRIVSDQNTSEDLADILIGTAKQNFSELNRAVSSDETLVFSCRYFSASRGTGLFSKKNPLDNSIDDVRNKNPYYTFSFTSNLDYRDRMSCHYSGVITVKVPVWIIRKTVPKTAYETNQLRMSERLQKDVQIRQMAEPLSGTLEKTTLAADMVNRLTDWFPVAAAGYPDTYTGIDYLMINREEFIFGLGGLQESKAVRFSDIGVQLTSQYAETSVGLAFSRYIMKEYGYPCRVWAMDQACSVSIEKPKPEPELRTI